MYPERSVTFVEVTELDAVLCGASRPGHFRGVCTVVLKLFNIVGPDVAHFGAKDFQQARIIRQMVRDLNVPVEVRIEPTVREPDGLALSSRNRYLSPAERAAAPRIYQALQAVRERAPRGRDRRGPAGVGPPRGTGSRSPARASITPASWTPTRSARWPDSTARPSPRSRCSSARRG